MGYRQVYIKKCDKLSFKNSQLVVTKDKEDTSIPLEDINYLLVEDCESIITTRLMAELGKNAIAVIICDEKHIPTSIMYPYNYHYKQLEYLQYQIDYTDKVKEELWKLIVVSKISNQMKALEIETTDEYTIEILNNYIKEVEPGDTGNREGLAAKLYFRSLFGSKFMRHYDDGINNALNYGYAILCSCLIRLLSIYGLLTYLGINHKSKTNNFNLAYDFVEPFRPIVDMFVVEHVEKITDELSYEIRKELVNIMNQEVLVDNKKYTVEYAMELLVKSYLKVLQTGEIKLSLPVLLNG